MADGPEYEMPMDDDEMVVRLHQWGAHEHPLVGDEGNRSRGNGVLLWFATDDFGGLVERVTSSNATVTDGPLFNPNGFSNRKIWLRGPAGYRVVVAGPHELEFGN